MIVEVVMTTFFLRFISRDIASLKTLPPIAFTYKSLIHWSSKYGESFSAVTNISEVGDLTCIRTGSTTLYYFDRRFSVINVKF